MDILSIVISLFAFLFAITIHEASHAWTAMKFGDPTASAMGRVSLNPLVHIDPIGTVLLPLILAVTGVPAFGWAKPVMVNPANLRHPRRDNLWISVSGPVSNMIAAAASLLLILAIRILKPGTVEFLWGFLTKSQTFPRGFYPMEGLVLVLFYIVLVNTYLAVFNLIPVPPLDGSGVLAGLLNDQAAAKYDRLRPYGFFIVLALIMLGGLNIVIRPILTIIQILIFF